MADSDHVLLTRPTKYNIEDTNIALLGSDLEKHVREEAGDHEPAWDTAGETPGTQVWRIEKFTVVEWPRERVGSFYDGDSYIVLHTYKKTPEAEDLSYDLHFWIGSDSTRDEAGTAAYKTVELDDHLHGKPVQYREIQDFESARFLSYFPRFVCLKGGVSTGFHHVSAPPPDNTRRLYRATATGSRLLVREVSPVGLSIVPGDAYVLDMGNRLWQLNTKGSVGKERFKAAEFVQSLASERRTTGPCEVTVFDEGGHGVGLFLGELGLDAIPAAETTLGGEHTPSLYRLSDSTGQITFSVVEPPTRSSLSSADVFLLDNTFSHDSPAIYVWIGKDASLLEKRLAIQYAQKYLYGKADGGRKHFATSIVRMREGYETSEFLRALSE